MYKTINYYRETYKDRILKMIFELDESVNKIRVTLTYVGNDKNKNIVKMCESDISKSELADLEFKLQGAILYDLDKLDNDEKIIFTILFAKICEKTQE